MKKLLLLLILSFFSTTGFAASCPDGSEPTKTVSADGSYYEYKCSEAVDTYGGRPEIPEQDAYPNYQTLKYYLNRYLNGNGLGNGVKLEIKASSYPYEFQYDLREDNYIDNQMQETALLSYLLYEDDKIVIDEITPKDRFGDQYNEESKYHSQSIGKTIVSYVTGHAICIGYIESVDSKLNDWPLIENTLYYNQSLINLLNMAAGDQKYANMNGLIDSDRWINSPSVESIMKRELKGSKVDKSKYNYNNLVPNTTMAYIIFKSSNSFQELLNDVFQEKVKIKDDVFFLKNEHAHYGEETFWYQFYATRSDYLRIAKAMLDDWQNDTCEGQYLKTIHDRKISKNGLQGNRGRTGLPRDYAGFFHTSYRGMENRPVMGFDGYGGQSILIDFERGRIVATQAIHSNYDWEEIVYETIKNGK